MYLGHFSLKEAPFSITPDTDFFYPHDGVQATLNMLLVALRSGEGFVKVVGEPDPATGYVIDLKILSDLVKEEVMERFDHKNLNLDTVEFAAINPTAENIAIVIYNLLRPRLDAKLDLQIRLYETERNFVEYPV